MEFMYIGFGIAGIITIIASAWWISNNSRAGLNISNRKIRMNIFICLILTAITGLCLLIIIQYKDEINKSMFILLNSLNIKDKQFFTIFPILVLIFYTYKALTRK